MFIQIEINLNERVHQQKNNIVEKPEEKFKENLDQEKGDQYCYG